MIPQETVDIILDTAQIADVVSDFVSLRRRGANLVACCPFHNEKTPSFYVSPSKGIYKCFGCGKSGTAVGFVMEHEHCTYVEALRYLARRYGIEVVEKDESADDIILRQRRESLLLVSEFAQKYYNDQLREGEGLAVGYAYFRTRGIEDETISRFGLGWAPSGRTALVDAALKEGYKTEYLVDAGLAVRHDDGTVSDKFRERVMFPIHSVSGRVVAFSGRTLRSDNPAKYVNSPETEIYVKSRNLLGIYFAKTEIARHDRCILVEGNVDMVMMHQLGIGNVVASCGTSLTIEQIRLIHKFTENVTIMYDGDSAGIHAALRGINMILAEGLNVRIVLLPDGEDPDSFCRKHSLAEVQSFIEGSEKDFIAFKTDLLLAEAAGDPLKKANLINDIADTIAQIPDPVKRSTYVDATAAKFGIESSILFERTNKTRRAMKEEVMKGEARAERIAQAQDRAPVEKVVSQPAGPGIENRTLALPEREILGFLMKNGCDILDFESDSEYYSGNEEDKKTVADFIAEALDGTAMANSIHVNLYNTYYDLYYEGHDQETMVRRILNSEDRDLAALAADLSTEKYQLTVAAFENALTTTSSWLVNQLPHALLVYQELRLKDRIDTLTRSLASASEEEQTSILQELMKLQACQRRIRIMSGREKTK